MWAVAIKANNPGKVMPCHCSKGKSEAMAKNSVTSDVVLWVIFSTPPTITTSYKPESTANIPALRATAEDAHAASVLMAGMCSKPAQSAIVEPVCP